MRDVVIIGAHAAPVSNQVPGARTALVQNMGGTGSTISVHILEAAA